MKRVIYILTVAMVLVACSKPTNTTVSTEAETNPAQEMVAATETVMASDFTLTDLQGNSFVLSSLRGQYVVLDFWGSWCGWCIKGMPTMKVYYGKYAGKFEIVGIDYGDSVDEWRAAVQRLELPWKHVYLPQMVNLLDVYEVTGFPTKIVISPEGEIIHRVDGEDPAFYEYLDSLFANAEL